MYFKYDTFPVMSPSPRPHSLKILVGHIAFGIPLSLSLYVRVCVCVCVCVTLCYASWSEGHLFFPFINKNLTLEFVGTHILTQKRNVRFWSEFYLL